MTEDIEHLRFPIGKYSPPVDISPKQIKDWIGALEAFPYSLRVAASNLTGEQLEMSYRPGGWTLRQVIHHLADSHLNGYMRFKLTVTEDRAIIREYDQAKWAECVEARTAPVCMSLSLLESVHVRWVSFLKTLSEEQYNRTYIHPKYNKEFVLKEALGMYDWHGRHHLAHITETLKSKG